MSLNRRTLLAATAATLATPALVAAAVVPLLAAPASATRGPDSRDTGVNVPRLSCSGDTVSITAVVRGQRDVGPATVTLHAGTGGVWSALVFGFAGMRDREEVLTFDPRLPETWPAMSFPISWRGSRLRIELSQEQLEITVEEAGDEEVCVRVRGQEYAVSADVSGISLETVGVILMVVGVLGLLLSILMMTIWADRVGRRAVVRDQYVDPVDRRY